MVLGSDFLEATKTVWVSRVYLPVSSVVGVVCQRRTFIRWCIRETFVCAEKQNTKRIIQLFVLTCVEHLFTEKYVEFSSRRDGDGRRWRKVGHSSVRNIPEYANDIL